jgi:hypothetical protein
MNKFGETATNNEDKKVDQHTTTNGGGGQLAHGNSHFRIESSNTL